ncbi:hypothetical protein 8G_00052 [Ralstonia phage Hyacinthe]|uniref:Uncharacterized protein n=3 Tax=Rahariannevirus raharianne TaxID=2846050 RepID=A0A7G5BBG7_9CAUD|nr:hypothetical protein KMC43_gp71 [Ralstonia phage Raharianne]QMV32446.1 hypothetical protein U2_00071 [Ralstonia phage Albius]QMV33484.1 hypothetical protein 8G_00052 [Ralstonia phage Hyacinthe]QMV33640.1 hypothetical protein Y2_00071 [Ralstonia phage Raharianne]
MHLTDNEAACRQAERENRLLEYARRKRWNAALNAAALGVMVYVAVVEIICHWVP